jgi:hypothetical protein
MYVVVINTLLQLLYTYMLYLATTTGAQSKQPAAHSKSNGHAAADDDVDGGYSSESFVDDKSNDVSTLSIPDLGASLPHNKQQQQQQR